MSQGKGDRHPRAGVGRAREGGWQETSEQRYLATSRRRRREGGSLRTQGQVPGKQPCAVPGSARERNSLCSPLPQAPQSSWGFTACPLSLLAASLPMPKSARSGEARWSPWGGKGLRKCPVHLHAQLAATASPLPWNVLCSPLSLCPGRQLRSQVSSTGKAANSPDQYHFKVQHAVTVWF